MKPIRFALSALALCAAFPAFAITTTTYNFSGSPMAVTNTPGGAATTSSTGATTFQNASALQYGDGGTNYGNTITWSGSTAGSSVAVSAWSTTGIGNTFEKAYIGNYGNGDLGVTGQPRTGLANAELTAGHSPDQSNNQHAIDNVGAYDALMFTFSSSVTLADVSIGFPSTNSSLDSDATILYYTGTGDPRLASGQGGGLSARKVSDLLSNGWTMATNIDLTNGNNATGLSTSISSKYWLVGAYMGLNGPSVGATNDGTSDYFKVNGVTSSPRAVPEPGSVALLGIAGIALFAARRRKVRN